MPSVDAVYMSRKCVHFFRFFRHIFIPHPFFELMARLQFQIDGKAVIVLVRVERGVVMLNCIKHCEDQHPLNIVKIILP